MIVSPAVRSSGVFLPNTKNQFSEPSPSLVPFPQRLEKFTNDLNQNEKEKADKILANLKLLVEPGQVVELRALGVENEWGSGTHTKIGFFDHDHLAEMAKEAARLDQFSKPQGIYFTLNPLNSDLLARLNNRVEDGKEVQGATDKEVVRRRFLLVDADPQRISGVSSTKTEKEKALEVIQGVRQYLKTQGFPDPILADSGNGYHLLYRIDLPTNDGGLVQRVLTSLATRFDTAEVKVDQAVFNPSRICKLYGTKARKGDSTKDRPHREAMILDPPEQMIAVPQEFLEKLAGTIPVSLPAQKGRPNSETIAPTRPPKGKEKQARRYLAKIPGAVSGNRGHDHTFHVACVLVLGFDLPIPEALFLIKDWNETCQPPWMEKELIHKLEDANKRPGPRGYLLLAKDKEAFSDPHRLARTFLEGKMWWYWKQSFWVYDGKRYVEIPDDEVRALISRHCEAEANRHFRFWMKRFDRLGKTKKRGQRVKPIKPKVTKSLVSNVIEGLTSLVMLSNKIPQPCWLPETIPGGAIRPEECQVKNLASLNNTLLDLDTMEQIPHTPHWFSSVCLPYDYDPNAKCPKFEKFLDRNLGGDQEAIILLQEFSGYSLTASTDSQKGLILVGDGGNGKSVFLGGLRAILGDDNISQVPLESFGQRFALSPTLGKVANICSEIGQIGKTEEAMLKRYMSGEGIQIERKGKDPFSTDPTARLVVATNTFPHFSDKTNGIWRRLLVVPFKVTIPESERILGMDKPSYWKDQGELPGMLNWALVGRNRLRERGGKFSIPNSVTEEVEKHRTESNSARMFLRDNYEELSNGGFIPTRMLFDHYLKWCLENGYKPTALNNFGKEIGRVFPSAQAKQNPRMNNQRGWYGLRVRNFSG